MKTKAGSQLVQAVLFMLAMVLGLLLLPGKYIQGDAECPTGEVTEPAAWTPLAQPGSAGTCSRKQAG